MEMQSLTVKIVSEMQNRGIIQAKEKNIYCSGWTVLVPDSYQEICRWNTCEEKGYLFAVYGMHFMVRTNFLWKYHLMPAILLHIHVCLGMLTILWLAPVECDKRRLSANKRLKYN